jgi:hypothetical protein
VISPSLTVTTLTGFCGQTLNRIEFYLKDG